MNTRFRVVSIHGVPRSGTSWLGQIFDSHPDVAYRHQPLFAYRFKDRLNLTSTRDEIFSFLNELYQLADDDFIMDTARREAASEFWESAVKHSNPEFLVMKMVRYHHLLSLFLREIIGIKIIGITRHPCAVINSWLQAPKEFRPGWCVSEEWRYAPRKNVGRVEEFNGFEKWKEVARMFMEFERAFPEQFRIIQYEHLVQQPEKEIECLFSYVGLAPAPQAIEFIQLSRSRHEPDPYAVFRRPDLHQRWRTELDPVIADEILKELRGTELERFLV